MARPSEQIQNMEVQRLELIHSQQRKLAKKLKSDKKKVSKAGGSNYIPGDEARKKELAILWKLGNPHMSFIEIANQIDERKSVVRKWFKEDPDVRERYQYFVDHFREGGIKLLETFTMEAVLTLVTLMRFGSEKYMYESSLALLDRGGIPKLTQAEVTQTRKTEHDWADKDTLAEQIRALPPELQEEAMAGLERFESLLSDAANGNGQVVSNESLIEEEENGPTEEA